MITQLFRLLRAIIRPPGPAGPKGDRGVAGPTGKTGKDAMDVRLIKLPVEVVLVEANSANLNRILDIRRALGEVEEFWAKMEIHLQPTFSTWQQTEDTLDYSRDEFTRQHYQRASARITLYIGSTLEVLPNTPAHVGKASPPAGPSGTAIIAGAHGGISEPGNLTPEIFNHELGHILGLEHDNNTFMREAIRPEDNNVSTSQKEDLRKAAYEWGSF